MNVNTWVVCFEAPDQIGVHSHQLLNKAHDLCKDYGATVTAICIGNYNDSLLQSLSIYGADEVVYSDSKCLEYKQVSSILIELFQNTTKKPQLILFPATEWGKCIAADLAIK